MKRMLARALLANRRTPASQLERRVVRHLTPIQQDRRNKSTVPSPRSGGPLIVDRLPIVAFPQSETRTVPAHIDKPLYATTGIIHDTVADEILLHGTSSVNRMRDAARLARAALDAACAMAQPGVTTDQIDRMVHEYIVSQNAYPSPLNYAGFPKSLCSSVNEIICHGIPDHRPLAFGDVVSFDVSCFLNGVHGDNCATVIVGDCDDDDDNSTANTVACKDWRGVPYRTKFATAACEAHFVEARRLVQAARDTLYAAIEVVKPGNCLSQIGEACQVVAEQHGYSSVEKYRGHGIGEAFHIMPFVKHYRNKDYCELREGMIFTIEPMICQYSKECFEWDDNWTVSTKDGGLAAQFEHTVLVTSTGVEILTQQSENS